MTTTVTAWHVETDAFILRRLGKALEELGELTSVLARCIIQGVNEVDPSSKKVNLQRMQEETTDVMTQINCLTTAFALDKDKMKERFQDKLQSMEKWEELLEEEAVAGELLLEQLNG